MFDNFLIREDSLQNVVRDDRIIGFRFAVRIADYRGCILSLHNGYYVSCDGEEFPTDLQRFEINGKPPRTFQEIKTCVWEHWNYDDEAYLYIEKEGGLTPGEHVIGLQQSILAQYGYMPWDEEWVKNPPVPGSGAGAGKTSVICKFNLRLQDRMHREG
ncbi:MAG: C-glycoside deglycosidase beta subunit domain-containing protein [Saccharofermentanales bacterium]|jgi:hypothetical protein|nr:hypothetical protein [Clostridiaceae bacterium]